MISDNKLYLQNPGDVSISAPPGQLVTPSSRFKHYLQETCSELFLAFTSE